MSLERKNKQRTLRRKLRVRSQLKNDNGLPRVSVFRSLNHMYVQLIDTAGKTIAGCSSLELKNLSGDKKAKARSIGVELATRAKNKGVTQAYFDRGSFLYHGRVQQVAEGLREGGLKV